MMSQLRKKEGGKLQVILGPMFSGKTSELIRRITRYKYAGYSCVVIHYASDLDMLHANSILSTHDGREIPVVLANRLSDLPDDIKCYDVIGIDEGQFFPDLIEFADRMSESGKKVIVAGLDGTFQRTGFENMLGLIPLAENVEKLTAVCMSCCNEAPYTKRIGSETEVEVFGGTDKYMAVCQSCFELPCPVKRSPFKQQQTSKALRVPIPRDILIDTK